MKIAEGLIRRSELNKKVSQLKKLLESNAQVQEGERAAFDIKELLSELQDVLSELSVLVKAINKTNIQSGFDNEMTLTDAIAEKDRIRIMNSCLQSFRESCTVKIDRYSRSEIKTYSTYDVVSLQKQIDGLAKEYREIDIKLQELNWKYDLVGV